MRALESVRAAVVTGDECVVSAMPAPQQLVSLQAHRADGSLLLSLRLTPDQVDDLVEALWTAHRRLQEADAA